jgi:hypothetical protein
MAITSAKNVFMVPKFTFTITDLARLLGKSPVTLRGWERQKLLKFPRDSGGDRKLTCEEIVEATVKARKLERINDTRMRLIIGAMGTFQFIETINEDRK